MGYDSDDSDESVATELVLFVDNDEDLYRQQFLPIIKNIARKIKRGVYNPQLAVKLWMDLMESGAKKYIKEIGGLDEDTASSWHEAFPKNIREMAAKEMSEREYNKIINGEYDTYLDSQGIHLEKKGKLKYLDRAIAMLDIKGGSEAYEHMSFAALCKENDIEWNRDTDESADGVDVLLEDGWEYFADRDEAKDAVIAFIEKKKNLGTRSKRITEQQLRNCLEDLGPRDFIEFAECVAEIDPVVGRILQLHAENADSNSPDLDQWIKETLSEIKQLELENIETTDAAEEWWNEKY